MKNISNIRTDFIKYFSKNGHESVPSSSMIPENDPSLLFTNAGMVQFKNIFTGDEKRDYKKAVTCQKCLRAGGKHNDLDNVGFTARHHTFFEMLGNFSFGDYFKEEAIYMAWDVITKIFSIDPNKLIVTVYHDDNEAYSLWKKIANLGDDKIIRISTNDNFWSMGNTGPCGPSTEIFYDYGEGVFGGPPGSENEHGDRFTEIWNLVFMQYEQIEDGKRVNLPSPSIDTGMGIERIASVLQGVQNNYDTDVFQYLIKNIQEITKNKGDISSYRIITDHLRATSFMIADGIMPSNEGRGYVLRRIMRRAMRHLHMMLPNEALMYKGVDYLTSAMGGAYPELITFKKTIEEILRVEENRFKLTLDKGLALLNEERRKNPKAIFPGSVAFKLYDTYGFPLDLTQDILRTDNISVDVDSFNTFMFEQKDRARKNWKGSGDKDDVRIYFELQETHKNPTEFSGYDSCKASSYIIAIIKDGVAIKKAMAGDKVSVITASTPFYAEGGGQVGDRGGIELESGFLRVFDTQKKLNQFIVHEGIVENGEILFNEHAELIVDESNRRKTAANHSATHLLHFALRSVLGDSVIQKGSLVTNDKLRFDFSYNGSLSEDELAQVERIVNHLVFDNLKRTTQIIPYDQAMDEGAIGLFGEKYDQLVRVISFGEKDGSIELCGGTHVSATGEIGLFKILSESGIAAGIRRIEAITGEAVLKLLENTQAEIDNLKAIIKKERIASKKSIDQLNQQILLLSASNLDKKIEKNNIHWGMKKFKVSNGDALKAVSDKLLKQFGGIVILTNVNDEKISIMIAVENGLSNDISASDLIKKATAYLGGKGGGGKKEFAQGGGKDISRIDSLLEFLSNLI